MRRHTYLVFLLLLCPAALAVTGPFNGKIAFVSNRDGNSEIYSMNANGSAQTRLTNDPANDSHPAWSPDGARIAFTTDRDGNNEIYVMNADGSSPTRITFTPASDSQPTWSPDGQRIAFQSTRDGSFDIFIMSVSGANVIQLTNDPGIDIDPAFSPTGTKIVFASSRDGNHEIYSMNVDGTAQTRLTNNTLFDVRPDFSPTGTKIVYASNVPDGGGFVQQVVLMNENGSDATVLTSSGANGNPTFSADGKRILFSSSRDLNTEIYSMAPDGSNTVRLTNLVGSDAMPHNQRVIPDETPGVYRPTLGRWFLHDSLDAGPPNVIVNFGGELGDLPVAGNWNGDDLTDLGVFNDGVFRLGILQKIAGLTIVQGQSVIAFGQAGDLPIAGDWNGDGVDDLGVFRITPSGGKFILRMPKQFGPFGTTIFFSVPVDFGQAGDLPVAGDWDGDGRDTIGVFRNGDPGTFLLTNQLDSSAEIAFTAGSLGDLPLAGDWVGLGRDGVGFFRDTTGMFLSTQLLPKVDFFFPFGQPGDLPVAGNWVP
jgi:hypothetical protein